MKQFLLAGVLALTASSAQAFDFFDNNSGEWKMGPNGPYYDESNWPQWTPMYWMEEMMDNFDDQGFGGTNNGNGFNMPFTNGNGFNMPFTNGNGFNMPFNTQMPNMGYGYQQPMYYPAPTQYQMPQMQQYQMPAPTMAAPVAPTAPAAPVTTAPGPAANAAK